MASVPTVEQISGLRLIQKNRDVTILPSLSRTAIQTVRVINYGGNSIQVTIDCTVAGTGSITVSVYHVDPVSGQRRLLLASAAITTVSTIFLRVFPGATASANAIGNDIVGHTVEIESVHNNANAITYSVAASFS